MYEPMYEPMYKSHRNLVGILYYRNPMGNLLEPYRNPIIIVIVVALNLLASIHWPQCMATRCLYRSYKHRHDVYDTYNVEINLNLNNSDRSHTSSYGCCIIVVVVVVVVLNV